jgi:2-polyprenyl-6-methoxyphenol hydroxylase-like FAD-dependent oxidoreductase
MAHNSGLNVIIVGAGIGGLASAIGLRQAGHTVNLFEKSKFGNEIGAAIVLPANVYHILKKLGVNPEEHGSNSEDIRNFHSEKGDLLAEHDFRGYGGTTRLIHRVDLHEALKGRATAHGIQINLSSPVENVDPETATITLANGEKFSGDVVIGADGIHSAIRKFIVPDTPLPFVFHVSMFRMLIPRSKLENSEETALFINPAGKMTVFQSNTGKRLVTYPCRSNTIINVAALFPTALLKPYKDDVELKQHMLEVFSDFHPSIGALLAAADAPGLWTLYDLPALPTWTRGRTTLIGDAAHPLLPYAAQGGAQALEDAAAISVLLGRGTTAADVHDRLQLFFDVRHERVEWVQDFARSSEEHSRQDPGSKPKYDPVKFFEEVHHHDAWGFAEEKLKEHLSKKSNSLKN